MARLRLILLLSCSLSALLLLPKLRIDYADGCELRLFLRVEVHYASYAYLGLGSDGLRLGSREAILCGIPEDAIKP